MLGLSFGSGLALELFRRHPKLPRSLLSCRPTPGGPGRSDGEAAEQRRAAFLRDADRPPDEVVREFSASLFTESVPKELVDEATEVMRDFHPAGLRAMANAFADADLRELLPQIDVPTLLLYGDADMRSPVSVGEELHARIPGSTLVVMPGPGHVVNLEAPERFNEEVRSFLGA